MGLDEGGGREGMGEQRADFEYFEVLLLKGWIWRKAAASACWPDHRQPHLPSQVPRCCVGGGKRGPGRKGLG